MNHRSNILNRSSHAGLQLVLLASIAGSSCSRSPEPDTPGQCPIDCSSAIMANSEYVASPITAPASVMCANMAAGAVRAVDPVLLMFKVTGKVGDTDKVPRRGISIQPVIQGAMDPTASEKAGNISKLADGTYEPTRFIGIATPKNEWCTDACGVFSIEVTPVCALGLDNTVTVTPTSGQMETTASTFVVSAAAPAATTLKDDQKAKR